MKLSTLGLGLVAVTSSLIATAAFIQPVSAATIGSLNGTGAPIPFTFNGTWEFTFLYSFGNDQSNFGVASGTTPITTFFKEKNQNSPGSVTPNTPVSYTFNGSETSFFLSTVKPGGQPTVFSSIPTPGLPKASFWIASAAGDYPALPSVDPIVGVPFPPSEAFSYFVDLYAGDGTLVIGVNDTFKRDRDYNDFIVKAKPVPVPAIVPGIALAAAFFGSKTLKRNKKESKTVA